MLSLISLATPNYFTGELGPLVLSWPLRATFWFLQSLPLSWPRSLAAVLSVRIGTQQWMRLASVYLKTWPKAKKSIDLCVRSPYSLYPVRPASAILLEIFLMRTMLRSPVTDTGVKHRLAGLRW